MLIFRLPLRRLLKRIEIADDDEIQKILLTIIHWENLRYPNEELIILSLPKSNSEKRRKYLKMMADLLRNKRVSDD